MLAIPCWQLGGRKIKDVKEFIREKWEGIIVGIALTAVFMITLEVIESTILKIALIMAK